MVSLPPLPRRMTALDAAFLHLETPEGPLHVGGISVFDGDVTANAVVTRLERRLDEAPRYLQRAVPAPLHFGHPAWDWDPAFDLRHHVRETHTDPPGTEAQLRGVAAQLLEGCLDRSRPLWELHVVRGLEGGRSALVSKIHHSMVDGVSGVELMNILYDLAPTVDPAPDRRLAPPQPAGAYDLLVDELRETAARTLHAGPAVARALAGLARSLRSTLDRALGSAATLVESAVRPVVRLPFNRGLTGARRLGWITLPMNDVREIAQGREGTINDVVLSVLADGLGRWLMLMGIATEGTFLRILVPVNVRHETERGTLGNRVTMIPIEVPFDGTPVERLEATIGRTAAMKRAGLADLLDVAVGAGNLVPAALQARALALATSGLLLAWSAPFRSARFLTANLVCTNVPGPPVALYGFGRRVVAHYPFVPLAFETGLNCGVFSYNGVLHVGLVADAGVVEDVEALASHVRAAYAELDRDARPAPVTGRVVRSRRRPASAPATPHDTTPQPPSSDESPPPRRAGRAPARRRGPQRDVGRSRAR